MTIRPAILHIVLGVPAGLLIAYIISRFSDNTPWDHDKLTGRQPEMLPPPPYPAEPPVYYILPERVYYVPQILIVSQVPEAIYGEDDGEELVQESFLCMMTRLQLVMKITKEIHKGDSMNDQASRL